MKKNKKETSVDKAILLLQKGQYEDLVEYCETSLKSDSTNAELWKLQGIGYGSLGNPKKARASFLKVLEITPKDETTLANYITACFHDQDLVSAAEGIDAFYGSLDVQGKSFVLDSVHEAIKEGVIEKETLPSAIKKILAPEIPAESLVPQIVYQEVESVSDGHGYMVYRSSQREMYDTAVAFIRGYRFEKGKPTVVEILNKTGAAWNHYEGGVAKNFALVQEAIEALASSSQGKFLGFKPEPIKHGFKLLGGF